MQEVYLAPVAARAAEDETAGDPRLAELMAWEAIQDSETAEDFAAYLDAYPEGLFRDLAETRRAALALLGPPHELLDLVIRVFALVIPRRCRYVNCLRR